MSLDNWGLEELNDFIFKKERLRIHRVMGSSISLETAENLWILSTMTCSFNITDENIQNTTFFQKYIDLGRLPIGLEAFQDKLRTISDSSDYDLVPYSPDLAGEFFVLNKLKEKSKYDKNYLKFIAKAAWEIHPDCFSQFLINAMGDYYPHFELIFNMDTGILTCPENSKYETIKNYFFALHNLIMNQNAEEAKQTFYRFNDLLYLVEKPEKGVAYYAGALFALYRAVKDDFIIQELREAHAKYPEDNPIAYCYVSVLIDMLEDHCDCLDYEDIVEEIRSVYKLYKEDEYFKDCLLFALEEAIPRVDNSTADEYIDETEILLID